MLPPRGAYAATPVSRFLQRFECRFCCLRVAAACTRALARARPILFFRVPPCFAALLACYGGVDETIYKLKPFRSPQRNRFSERLKPRLVPLDTPSRTNYVVVTSVVAIDCSRSTRAEFIPRVRFPAERFSTFFLLFFGLGRPVRQADQFSRQLDAMPKTTTERRAEGP